MAENTARGNVLVNYIKESKEELKKVNWPSRDRVIRDTLVVFALSAAVAAFFAIMDYGLTWGFQKII